MGAVTLAIFILICASIATYDLVHANWGDAFTMMIFGGIWLYALVHKDTNAQVSLPARRVGHPASLRPPKWKLLLTGAAGIISAVMAIGAVSIIWWVALLPLAERSAKTISAWIALVFLGLIMLGLISCLAILVRLMCRMLTHRTQ
jgi:hypothetical protein